MARLIFVHWHQEEAEARAAALSAAGHEVRVHWASGDRLPWSDPPPDAVVLSLERLPSHGRAVADWVWEAKKRQTIPLLFLGGAPEKVEAARRQFPGAHFCPDLPALLAALGEPAAD